MLDNIQLVLSIGVAKITTSIVRFLKLGAASVLPGAISRYFYPKILYKVIIFDVTLDQRQYIL